jgi:hypothetical protein
MAKIKSDLSSEQEVSENQSTRWGTDEEIAKFVEKYKVSKQTAIVLNNEVFPWIDEIFGES